MKWQKKKLKTISCEPKVSMLFNHIKVQNLKEAISILYPTIPVCPKLWTHPHIFAVDFVEREMLIAYCVKIILYKKEKDKNNREKHVIKWMT